MIKAKRVNSIENDFETIRSCCENGDFYKKILFDNQFSGIAIRAIGHSIVKTYFDACEAALRVLWNLKSSPDGTLPPIKMNKIRSKGKEYGIPVEKRIAAGVITDLQKEMNKNGIDMACLAVFLKYVTFFLEWIISAIEEELKNYTGEAKDASDVLSNLKEIARYCRDMFVHMRRMENDMREIEYFDTDAHFILIPNADSRSEEELDRIYAPRSMNSRKSLLPVYIIKILKNESSKENPLIQKEIQERLRTIYELEVDRKSVARCLNTLIDDDLNVWTDEKRTGYWYSEERQGWEHKE